MLRALTRNRGVFFDATFLFILDTGLFAEALKEEQENEHS